jgi:predicted dehydrogenase
LKEKQKIRMAVVGLRFGQHITDNQICSGPGAPFIELAGVFDLDEVKATKISRLHNVRQYESLDEILTDPSVEAVGLFTPPNGRAKLIRKIIRAGKHVMTTKPFELDAKESFAVLSEARALNKIVHANSPEPLPSMESAQILQWQEEFQLGQPVSVRWETYTRYHEVADGGWYDDRERCPVAPIFRLGIYGINQLLLLCGKVDAVSVAHTRLFTGRPTADNAELSMQFANGALGSVFASFCIDDGHRYANSLCIHYERGTVRSSALKTRENHDVIAKEFRLQALDERNQTVTRCLELNEEQQSGKYQWDNFYRAVREGCPLDGEITPEMIAHSVQVINAMCEADRTGRQVFVSELISPRKRNENLAAVSA